MTNRKKKGIGFFISGAIFIAAGAVYTFLTEDPGWFWQAIGIVGLVASSIGFVVVYPDKD